MTGFKDIFDLRHKISLRWGLLLLSSLFISSATTLVYGRMIYETALNVGNAGSGSRSPPGVSLSPPTILVLAVSVFVVSLSLFGFLHEARKHIRNSAVRRGSLPTVLETTPLGEEVWEESPRKEEESPTSSSG
jgi:hypothetical protein